MKDLEARVLEATKIFWNTRDSQGKKQKSSGKSDAGHRSAVTGGKQMEGFEQLAYDIALAAGIDESITLPGFYRPTKDWDLLIVDNKNLVAAIEFKSQVGPSFGNNFNNRLEESVGTATDLNTAYREGAFTPSPKPWLGYLFVLEDCDKSQSPVKVKEPHFKVFEEFRNASYAERYQIMLQKLLREGLYDGCSLILSQKAPFKKSEPLVELSAKRFFTQFKNRLRAYVEERDS